MVLLSRAANKLPVASLKPLCLPLLAEVRSAKLCPELLCVSWFRGGVILRLLHPVADDAKSFFQKPGGPFAIGSFEAHGIDLNVSNWRMAVNLGSEFLKIFLNAITICHRKCDLGRGAVSW